MRCVCTCLNVCVCIKVLTLQLLPLTLTPPRAAAALFTVSFGDLFVFIFLLVDSAILPCTQSFLFVLAPIILPPVIMSPNNGTIFESSHGE